MPGTTPFYLDWKFWSAVIAFAALILSQLPPLHILFRRARLRVDTLLNIVVTHKVGIPNLALYFHVSNVGGRTLSVRSFSFRVRRDNADEFVLPGTGYYETRDAKNAVFLVPFTLKPNEDWAHTVQFTAPLTRQDDQRLRQLQEDLRRDIVAKRAGLPKDAPDVAADDGTVAPIIAFHQQRFRWHPGEYRLTARIEVDPPGASVTREYRFTLFESDSDALDSMRHQYKFGSWVILDPQPVPWVRGAVVAQLADQQVE